MTSRKTKVAYWSNHKNKIVRIPEDELSPSMIATYDKKTKQIVWIDELNIEKEKNRFQNPFKKEDKEKIGHIAELLSFVDSKNHLEWELFFRKEIHPFQEIDAWLKIAKAFDLALNSLPCNNNYTFINIYQSFIICSCYSQSDSMLKNKLKEYLNDSDISTFIEIYQNA